MSDELVSALLKESNLKVVLAITTQLARHTRDLHEATGAAASVFAQGLTGGVLIASLQKKETSRVNLQLACDGALGGFLADAGSDGTVRGWVKNPYAAMAGAEGQFKWRPVYGNSGFISVLRDMGEGEFYRSSVELHAFDLSRDLERYYVLSEQIPTAVALDTIAHGDEPLGLTAGVLIQPLPDGDRDLFEAMQKTLHEGAFSRVLQNAPAGSSAPQLLAMLLPDRQDLDVLSRVPVKFECTCSVDRVKRALLAMGRAELEDVLATDGKAEATCQFCSTHYVISGDEIRTLLAAAGD